MTASLYFHVPFCAGACDYCDFYSLISATNDTRLDRYVDRLLDDTADALRRYGVETVPSVFIGGGTPSLLGAARLERLLTGLARLLPNQAAEISLEANPESVDESLLQACLDGGVTRLSLGIQSLDQRSRRAVGRIGTVDHALRALALAAAAYPAGLSVDLMSGLPFQGLRSLRSDIEKAVLTGAGHVSLYALTLEAGTPLAERARRGLANLPPPGTADDLWIAGRDALKAAGFEHYEVSNFARPGRRCAHNRRYWRLESWLGCGPAASGTIVDEDRGTARRLTVPTEAAAYLAGPAPPEEEFLDPPTLLAESLIMGFRTTDGPDPASFRRRFGRTMNDAIGRTLEVWGRRGLMRTDRLALTEAGLLLLDRFLVDCLTELDGQAPRSYTKPAAGTSG